MVRMGGYNFEVIGVLEKRKAGSLGKTKKITPSWFRFAPRKNRTGQRLPAADNQGALRADS